MLVLYLLLLQVEHRRVELLKHPVVKSLIKYKWKKYGQVIYFFNLAFYALFLIFLTSFAVVVLNPSHSTCKQPWLLLSRKIWQDLLWFGRVYFRISLKRGQTYCGKFQEGQIQILRGGQPILNTGKANYQGGGTKTPPRPPWNKPWFDEVFKVTKFNNSELWTPTVTHRTTSIQISTRQPLCQV